MSRAHYTDDVDDQWQWIRWRGAVASAFRGARGQAFLTEMLRALDALPEPKLIAHELEANGAVCAIGAVGKARGIDMTNIDPEDSESVAGCFGIADAMACEIVYMNDEGWWRTPEARYSGMRQWIANHLKQEETA